MVNFPKTTDEVRRRFEADARQLVPIDDEIGGTVIYLGGRPAYYVLDGEWFQAVPGPRESPGSRVEQVGDAPASEFSTNEMMSTS